MNKFKGLLSSDFDRLYDVLTVIDSDGITFQRLVNILKQMQFGRDKIAGHDWVRSIINVVLDEHFENPEMQAFIRVSLRRAYKVNYQSEQSVHYPKIMKVLNNANLMYYKYNTMPTIHFMQTFMKYCILPVQFSWNLLSNTLKTKPNQAKKNPPF